MTDHTFTFDETRSAYREAARWWWSLVGAIEDHQWTEPGVGEWNITELVAHGDRALSTVREYLTGETKDPTPIATAAEYFRIVLSEETPHAHIAERARRDAAQHRDWAATTDALVREVESLVAAVPGDTTMHLFVGEMPLDQYLATRVVELVTHGLDLSAAIRLPTPAPAPSLRVALAVLMDLASSQELSEVVLMMTGRTSYAPLRNVLQ